MSRLEEQVPVRVPDRPRLAGLDGLRGLAALYVLFDHCWLLSYPGFPSDNGPWWLGWLMFGHFAVVFFLVVSGFSLGVGPARAGWRLGSVARYARRRAWRILPPYWAALLFSVVVAAAIVPQPHSGPPTAGTLTVYGLLLQDVAVAPTPNGAFWSIAVEAELYLVLPLLLLLRRRLGAAATLALAVLPVVVLGLVGLAATPPTDKLTGLTPQLAPLFALGVVAAGITVARDRVRRLPWPWLTALAATPVLALVAGTGSVWTAHHFFWVDLAFGPAMALLVVSVTTGRPVPLVRFLDTRPVRQLGSFSYSLYLVHLPVVTVVSRTIGRHHLVAPGLPTFLLTFAVAVPAALLLARGFAAVFEIPFQRHRGWPWPRAGAAGQGESTRTGLPSR